MKKHSLSNRTRWIFRQRPCDDLPGLVAVSVRVDWEASLDDLMQTFERFLLMTGFSQSQIRDYIAEWADDISEHREPKGGEDEA